MRPTTTMDRNRIEVFPTPSGWVAWYFGPHAEEVSDLFGTVMVPTAYGRQASLEMVVREIGALNPGVVVEAFRGAVTGQVRQ